jgi:hypothetical protein
MTTITLDDCEFETVIAALRLVRIAIIGHPDASDLTREQVIPMGRMIGNDIMVLTSETGEPLELLEPVEIDDLVDRLRSVRG